MSKNVLFRRFLRNPVQVGALCPSSRALCSTMVSEIGVDTADVIVELGPGTGVITREIVRCMSPNAKLIAIELDQTLCEHLRKAFPEVTVCNGRIFPPGCSGTFSMLWPSISRRAAILRHSPICRD